jgi:mono/diheme cytochrome c family protein
MFRSLRLALVALALLGLQGGVLAGEAVRQFAQELLEHEARQMRQPSVALKYSDGKDGAALRQLMSPERGGVVIQDWLASQVRGETDTPDIPTLIKPLINRYQKAFAAMPRDFGEEYLDSFNWVALVMRGGRDLVRMPATPAPPGPAIDPATLQQLRSASDRLMNTVMGMAQGVLRRHIADGMFGPELMAKAIAVLVKLTPDAAAIPLDPPTPAAPKPEQNNLRIVQTGKQVYASSCAACHTPGIAGAPKQHARPGRR